MEEKEITKLLNSIEVEFIDNNHILIYTDDYIILQSYNSKVGLYKDSTIYLTFKWNISRTTLKNVKTFINKFTNYNVNKKSDIEKLIKENKIKLI